MLEVHGGLLAWTVLTFVLLLVVLKKVAWGPILDALDARENEIKDALNAAEKAREEAERISSDYEDSIRKAQAEAQQIISDAKTAGEKVKLTWEPPEDDGDLTIDEYNKIDSLNKLPALRTVSHASLEEIKNHVIPFLETKFFNLDISLYYSNRDIEKLINNGLINVGARENVIRILPPLNVSKKDLKIALKIIEKTCIDINSKR